MRLLVARKSLTFKITKKYLMKKLITSGLLLFTVLSLSAQTKITKTSVVGKWVVSAVEMKDMFFYSVDKDSLGLGETMKAQLAQAQQPVETVVAMIKPQMAVFSKISFQFNADGTAELVTGVEAPQAATYTVDEANSTITTKDKDKKEETIKAEMVGDKLHLTVTQPQGEVQMTLKKAK